MAAAAVDALIAADVDCETFATAGPPTDDRLFAMGPCETIAADEDADVVDVPPTGRFRTSELVAGGALVRSEIEGTVMEPPIFADLLNFEAVSRSRPPPRQNKNIFEKQPQNEIKYRIIVYIIETRASCARQKKNQRFARTRATIIRKRKPSTKKHVEPEGHHCCVHSSLFVSYFAQQKERGWENEPKPSRAPTLNDEHDVVRE